MSNTNCVVGTGLGVDSRAWHFGCGVLGIEFIPHSQRSRVWGPGVAGG